MLWNALGSLEIFQDKIVSIVFLYLIINILSISVPLAVSFDKRIMLWKEWKAVLIAITGASIPFLLWDQHFTEQGYWGFNTTYISGLFLADLPIEEVLFFICIPFACIFTHVSILKIKTFSVSLGVVKIQTLVFLSLGTGTIILYHNQAYTTWVMSFLIITQLIGYLFFKDLLRHYIITFLFMLIPFIIVNGVLTGAGIENEVVWYNDLENFGIRFFTIPIEDFVYAYALILLNLMIFQKFAQNKTLLTPA